MNYILKYKTLQEVLIHNIFGFSVVLCWCHISQIKVNFDQKQIFCCEWYQHTFNFCSIAKLTCVILSISNNHPSEYFWKYWKYDKTSGIRRWIFSKPCFLNIPVKCGVIVHTLRKVLSRSCSCSKDSLV